MCRKETAAINWERKSVQTAMGSKLRGLEQEWVQLVSHNYRIERAIAELEAELAEAQAQDAQEKEQEVKEQEVIIIFLIHVSLSIFIFFIFVLIICRILL